MTAASGGPEGAEAEAERPRETGSPLRSAHERAGVRWADWPAGPDGAHRQVPRNYGDPASEYGAAVEAAIVVDRADRAVVRVFGRDPVRMVHGLVTNDVEGLAVGGAVQAAMLTAKGRMLADVRVLRRSGDLLIEADIGALANVRAVIAKYVPPLFARLEEAPSLVVIGLYGPASPRILEDLLEDDPADSVAGTPPLPIATDYAGRPGTDLLLPADVAESFWDRAIAAGATPAGHATLDVLRIEAGHPRWGADLDEDVIPIEAGLLERMIHTGKGCYTGQEVIVRILHRGHVNRHLRGILLGDAAAPARGEELFAEGAAKPTGRVTSACFSPRAGQTIALGYVRREIEPGTTLRLGSGEGPRARIVALPFADPAP